MARMKTKTITSNNLMKQIVITFCLLLSATFVQAQVTGSKTIGVDYPTLAAAIADLNTIGISGPVIINIPGGYTETAPAGGFLLGSTTLNASTSATNTLLIQKNSAGTNPLFTAPVGTSTTVDGIFVIQGTDYVTLSSLDFTESAANTTATTWMEWGIALVKLQATAPYDGCQNVLIRNCRITLNRLNTTTVGIYAGNHIATATTALPITATSDAMSDCRFFSNTIQNSVTGISLRGYAAAAAPYDLYDQNNKVGNAGTGNIIQNFGGTTTGAAVNLQYQNNAEVINNTINNTAATGIPATSILYGIYVQNGKNTTIAANSNLITLTSGTTGSAMYGINITCSGTGTIDVNSNRFTANGGSTGSMYMIYFGGANTDINTNSNTFYNINVATTGSLYMIYHSTASGIENITCNNNVTGGTSTPYVTKTGSGGTVAGYYNNSGVTGGFVQFNNNRITNVTMGGSSTFYGLFENDGGTGQNKFARNHIVSNITSAGGTLYGLWMGYSASETFSDNTVSALNAGSGIVYGIYVNTSSNLDTVVSNNVNNLTSTGGNIYGVYVNGGTNVHVFQDTISALTTGGTSSIAYGIYQASGTTVNIYKNRVYDISGTGTGSSAYGLYVNSGTTNVYNNLVGDIRTPNYNGATGTQLAGIYTGAGTAHNISYNSVYINATSTGAAFGSSAMYSGTVAVVTSRNNILVNTSTPKGAGLTMAYRRSGVSLTNYGSASNNNLFYAGTPGASNVIFSDGTTSYSTLASFKTLVAPRDANSVTENPPFVSTIGSAPSFLHISTTVPTQVESGGVNITGIEDDAEGTVRAGNPGYVGAGTAPDMGAIEGNYVLTDKSAPTIALTPLPSGCSTGDRTFSVNISDATGVPTTGTQVPRVYFRKGSGSWFSNAGTLTSGTSTSGTWDFTISAAPMGGLAIGDVVSYFIIAEDIVATPNIGSNPGAGLVASDVNTITTYPTTPFTYTIIPVLSGTYNVGVGMAYTTITSAIADYNSSCVSGNVVFQLTDATYPTETFPITINNNGSSSPANTLTIRPAAGVSPTISGSSTSAVFVLNGADYVTIDGSNAPVTNSVCPAVAATRDLTIANTSTSTTSAVIWLQTATGGDAATNNNIRNINIQGSGNTRTLFGVGSGGTSISYTSVGTNNNDNHIENNRITATQTGIYSMGASATDKNTGTVINQNSMDGTAPDNLRNNGIFVGFEDGIVISGNSLAHITNSVSNDIIGINLGFNNNATSSTSTTGKEVTNALVTNNKLDSIVQSNTFSCIGIAVSGATSGTNTIANNMLSGVLSKGTGGDFSAGIFIGGTAGGTTRVYYNTIDMSGTITGASYPSFAVAVSGTNPIVDLKNNIFTNHASTGSTYIFAIGLAYTTYTNLSSDRNNFFSIGTNMGTVGSLAGTGTSLANLAAWQSATGNDAGSKEVDPAFVSSTDLHLTTSSVNIPLMDAGTPVSITNDIDCAARGATTPDLGINEFNIPLCGTVVAGTLVPDTATFCNSGSTTINLVGGSVGVGINYQWQSSPDSSSWTVISGATSSSFTTPVLTATTFYRVVQNCIYSGLTDSADTKVTINPLPAIAVTPDGGSICSDGTGLSMTASGASTYTWSPAIGLSTISGTTVNANPPTTTSYLITGTDVNGCVNTHTSIVSVTMAPDTFSITPAVPALCAGSSSVMLSAIGAALPAAGPFTAASGTLTLAVPDATATGVTTSQIVSGIPLGATITDVSIQFNIAMTYDGDLSMNLTAPNGKTLNLVNRRGTGGDNFVNTVVSSTGGITFVSSAAPFTNTYSADAALAVGPTVSPSNTSSWADLLTMMNGTWTFSVRDHASGDKATINDWILTINYTYNPAITWAPVTGLYTDPGATTAYTGGTTADVFAKPATTTTYVATLSLGACTNTKSVTVNVTPLPDADTITGPSSVCLGSSVTFTDTASGGTWAVTNPRASVTSTGLVTGLATGTDTLMYIVSNACGIDTAKRVITIDVFPVAGTIVGPSSVCEGSNITLSDSSPRGVWSSSTTSASVTAGGVVTGIAAGTSTISYTVANGCGTVFATHPLTVNPRPDAGTVSGPASVCEGNTILLSSTAPGGVWSATNTTASVTPAGIVTGLAGGIDTIRYTFTNTCGTDVESVVIAVGPLPDPGTISGPAVVCIGATITLSETQTGGRWFSSNSNATVGSTGVVTGVAAGSVVISYEATNTCGTTYALHSMTVISVPDAGVITGPTNVCAGSTISLSDAAPGGVWTTSDASVATVTSGGLVTGVASGSVFISYTVSLACGTADTFVLINVDATPNVYTVTGGGTFCAGGSGVDVSLSGSEPGISYQLYVGSTPAGGAISGTGSPISFGFKTAPGTYKVVATNTTTGCTRPMSGTATIIANPTVPPTVSIVADLDPICLGSSVTFTAIPVNGGATPTYQWKVNGVNTGTGVSYTYVPAIGDVVSVMIKSSPCAMPDTGSGSFKVNVIPYTTPSVSINVGATATVCQGNNITMNAVPVLGGVAPIFVWSKNGTAVATGPTYSYIPANGDIITVLMVSNNPCRNADSVTSINTRITTVPVRVPMLDIVATPGTSINNGQSATLTAVAANAGTAPTYQWYINRTPITGATNATYTSNRFVNGDTVSAVVFTNSICMESASRYVVMHVGNVGVQQATAGAIDISVIPNPNKGEFTVKGNLGITTDELVNFEITDMLGQVVYRSNATAKNGTIEESISLKNTLANGMYLLNVSAPSGSKVFHIVVER